MLTITCIQVIRSSVTCARINLQLTQGERVDDEGACTLAKSLKQNMTITVLELQGKQDIDDCVGSSVVIGLANCI